MKMFKLKEGYQLAVLRIGVAIAILTKVFVEFSELDLMYSRNGIVQDVLSRPLEVSYVLSLHGLSDFLHIQDQHVFLNSIYIVLAVAALLLLVGFQTKLNVFICLLIHIMVFNSYNLIAFGFDGFLFSLLFYCLIFPTHKVYTIDQLMDKKHRPLDAAQLSLFLGVVQVHLCIVYFTAGYSKLGGQEWMNGTAIWKAINQPQFYTAFTPLIKSLACYPVISYALTWGTLLAETAFPFLIWIKWAKVRAVILISIVMMHIFIAVVMGLQLFAWIMIVFDLSAFAGILFKAETVKKVKPEQDPDPLSYQLINTPAIRQSV